MLVLGSLVANSLAAPVASNQPLRFTANGTFQLSIFEDLHYGEGEYTLQDSGPAKSKAESSLPCQSRKSLVGSSARCELDPSNEHDPRR